MNTKKVTAFIVGAMLIATVLVMAVSAAGMDRSKYAGMQRMVYEFDAVDDTGIYINDDGMGNTTVRIYGEEDAIYPTQSYTEADDFIYPDPVDAFDPGVIGEDSVTFNPAYMDDAATIDGGLTWDDMKVFLRVFYEPEYGHVKDGLMESTIADWQRKNLSMPEGALVTETTYMLVENNDLMTDCSEPYNTGHSGDPIIGAADVTQFTMPVNSDNSYDGNPGMDVDELVDLLSAVNGDTVTDGEIEVGMTHNRIATNVPKRFMDHEVVFTGSDSNYAFFEITYLGNMDKEEPATETLSVPLFDQRVYVTRYHYTQTTTDPAHRWFITVSDVNCAEWCDFTIGRYLAAGETFYVDGVRYDMPAIYVTDDDEFKYITLQSPLPKCTGCECVIWVDDGYDNNQVDYSHVSNQWLARLLPGVSVWMLPPFDIEHQMIDDIDLDKKYNIVNECWYLDTEAGNIIQYRKPALEFCYADEDIEGRFNSSLAERHHIRKDGVQIWNWWNIYTKPYNYTTLVLPDQETTDDTYKLWDGVGGCNPGYIYPAADGNEYLVTTSFIAPNSEAEEREELCKSSDNVHDIIDRAADIAVVDDDRRDAYLGMPRMVFEYDAVDTEDLFVNDDGMGNATVRVYGEAGAIYPTQSMTGAVDFIYPDAVDPFDPGVVVKGSVTFNPAYIENSYESKEITVDGSNGDEKVYLRAFYEPEYYHPIDAKMNNAGSGTDAVYMENGALVVETTYMLLQDNSGSGHSGDPKAGAARDGDGNVITYFMLPTHSNNLFNDVAGMNRATVVDLNWASGAGTTQLTDGEIEVQTRPFTLVEGQAKNFMDHKIRFVRPTTGMEIKLDISYIGNMKKVEDRLKEDVEVNEDQKYYVDRLNNLHSSPDPDWRFYFEVVSMTHNATSDKYEANLIVGRYLAAGETFYVDGVRYDMPAIYVTDEDKFKYITFQTPLPKCDGEMWYDANEDNQADKSHVTCQWLANILEREIVYDADDVIVDILNNVWVLPPFNAGHTMIDDIDLDKSWNCGGIWENISVEEAGNILGEVDPLEFYYIAEEAELRFDSSLAERHAYDGSDEIWNWWSIFTKPCQYTEIVLPDQETTGMSDGNEYLITTSFIAPNCEGAVRDMDNEPFCKPYDTHDIIDRASTILDPVGEPECPCDLTGDDYVNNDDVIELVNNWGACTGCAADLTGDDYVNNDDVIELVNNWGAC